MADSSAAASITRAEMRRGVASRGILSANNAHERMDCFIGFATCPPHTACVFAGAGPTHSLFGEPETTERVEEVHIPGPAGLLPEVAQGGRPLHHHGR